jgi:hypothetical protein
MAFLNALADVLRPRPTMQTIGTASSAADTTYASMSTTGAVAGGPPPATGALETSPQMTVEEYGPSTQEKQLMLHRNVCGLGLASSPSQLIWVCFWRSILREAA